MCKAKLILTVAEAEKNHDKWLELRNKGIGGSDAGTIMGLNPYKSRLKLWMEKTGKREPDDLSGNQRVYWGIVNEPNIATWFTEETGKKVRRCGTMQSEKHPWLLANVDRMVEGENAGLEIKTAGVSQAALWKGDEVPDSYYCQCQHYMMVTGCEKWYIAVLIGGNEAIYKEIPRNEEFIRDMFHREAAFWSLVENDIMPEVDGEPDTATALNELYPQATDNYMEVDCTEDLDKLFDSYQEYKKSIKTFETYAAECENKIKALMGENELIRIGDKHKATWSNMAGRVTIDTKRLQSELPEVFEKYKKVGKASRRFSMK